MFDPPKSPLSKGDFFYSLLTKGARGDQTFKNDLDTAANN